jgi:hypothetical protein
MLEDLDLWVYEVDLWPLQLLTSLEPCTLGIQRQTLSYLYRLHQSLICP